MQGGQHVAPFVGDRQLDHGVEGPEPVGEGVEQAPDALAGDGRYRHGAPRLQRHQRVGIGDVELVGHQQLGDLAGAEGPQHRADGFDVAVGVGR